ncbi:transforming acidic coiled-coil-containing protein 1-like isoform X2 [Rhopalosiphum maidis]|uniref:transforming acidic coiled-coil-containing protein 1-like isoform X2 n=1 Tax=Rhopalosiphum maidis TaxID=43146 RepID=UPI000F00AA06|nr:transforming acidic coiled-coil-containing protein 1-like isoform X2 [Rhopalosiphum maidis]
MMLDQENQPNIPNGTESSNSSFQDKTVIKNDGSDNIFSNHEEYLGDVSLGGFNVSQLTNKLERLALATPQVSRIRPDSTVFEEDFDLKERPDSADSDSDSVENQQLDSLDFSSTICNEDINDSGGNIESIHEHLNSVNLDLVSSDFEDSSHNLTLHSFSNKSSEELSHQLNPDFNDSAQTQNILLMDGLGSEKKFQSNIFESEIKNSSEAGPVIAEGFNSSAGFNFDNLEALESVRSLNEEDIRRLTISRKSLYVAFDPIVKKSNEESNSRKEAIENLLVADKTVLTSSPQSSGSNKSLNISDNKMNQSITKDEKITNSPKTNDKEKFYQDKIEKLEYEIKNLKIECIADKEKIKNLTNSLISVTKSKDQLSTVIGEYEKTISDMVSKKEDVHKEYEARIAYIEEERAKMERHLQNSEMAFNDVHEKYNSSKQVIEAMKENETKYKNCIKEFEESLKKYEDKYMRLKIHATEQMNKATEEINDKERSFEAETSKMRIMNKRLEVKVRSLQESLDRKDVENVELTNLCDELIGKLDRK